MTEWEGVFPLWKEAGMTSHDCVSKARRLFGMKRIGHTGTLDPDVSGVLPLCLGRATRIVEYVQELPKTYEAEMTVGYATDTEDSSGTIVEQAENVTVSDAQIRDGVSRFIGRIEQIPPMYSAVKVEGKRLYEMARAGETVERKAREVTVYEIEILEIRWEQPFPKVRMTVTCSKGTYIRTLCADIGRSLGYPAVMSALVRTRSGPILKEQCITFEEARRLAEAGKLKERLIPTDEALSFMPRGDISESAVVPAQQGRKLFERAVRPEAASVSPGDICRLYGNGRFIGIYRYEAASESDIQPGGRYVPVKLFT